MFKDNAVLLLLKVTIWQFYNVKHSQQSVLGMKEMKLLNCRIVLTSNFTLNCKGMFIHSGVVCTGEGSKGWCLADFHGAKNPIKIIRDLLHLKLLPYTFNFLFDLFFFFNKLWTVYFSLGQDAGLYSLSLQLSRLVSYQGPTPLNFILDRFAWGLGDSSCY